MSNITDNLVKFGKKFLVIAKNHAPEILTGVGILGTITSTVMACAATTKVEDTIEDAKIEIEIAHKNAESVDSATARKEIALGYFRAGKKFVKLYGPSAMLGVASITGIVSATAIQKHRNTAIAAEYTALCSALSSYRERVADNVGTEIERNLFHGVRTEKVKETVVDPETGEEKKVKTSINVKDNDIPTSEYSKFFDEMSREYKKDPEYNLMFLKGKEKWANHVCQRDGFIFLNDVYDMLDIPKTKAGQLVGWVYDDNDPEKIDFGIFNVNRARSRDFVNGYEKAIMLNFNVDGYILDQVHFK